MGHISTLGLFDYLAGKVDLTTEETEHLQDCDDCRDEAIDGKRFIPPNPQLLDYEGTELLLISAAEDIQAELGSRLMLNMNLAGRRRSLKICKLGVNLGANCWERN